MLANLVGQCLVDGTLCQHLMTGPGEHPINPSLSLRAQGILKDAPRVLPPNAGKSFRAVS